jgi:glucokinase
MKKPLFVGLDVGGTAMKAGVVDDVGKPLGSVSLPTEAHRGQEFGLERMCESIRQAVAASSLKMSDIAAIGVATPGTMDIPAAYGEYWAGAGKDAHSMVLFTLGTGVGGGIIIGDLVLEGEHSHGGELGHMKIEITNPLQCGCGRWGCLEAYASATGVVKRADLALAKPHAKSSLEGKKDLSARDIFDAAAAGDALAKKIAEDTAFYLAVGAMNMMHTIDPDMVVFTGGMIAAGDWFLDLIRKFVKELAFPVPAEKTMICYAQLGIDAGFIGAAGCGRLLFRKQ